MKTQTDRLHAYLKRKSITPLDAWTELGIYRLAARVFDLRERGIPVKSTMIEVENRWGEVTKVARYSL